jgi:hypothetical protein
VVAEIRERVEILMTWPVNDPAALETALDLGVNAVITDDSAILRRLLGNR